MGNSPDKTGQTPFGLRAHSHRSSTQPIPESEARSPAGTALNSYTRHSQEEPKHSKSAVTSQNNVSINNNNTNTNTNLTTHESGQRSSQFNHKPKLSTLTLDSQASLSHSESADAIAPQATVDEYNNSTIHDMIKPIGNNSNGNGNNLLDPSPMNLKGLIPSEDDEQTSQPATPNSDTLADFGFGLKAIMRASDIRKLLENVNLSDSEISHDNSSYSSSYSSYSPMARAKRIRERNNKLMEGRGGVGSDIESQFEFKKNEFLMNSSDWIDDAIEEVVHEVIQSSPEFQVVPRTNQVKDLDDIFEYVKQLGSGGSCRVILARHKRSKNYYALKQLKRQVTYNSHAFVQEIKILKLLDHVNIVRFEDAYVDSYNYYIATQYCKGGPLLGKLKKTK